MSDLPIWNYPDAVAATRRILQGPARLTISRFGRLTLSGGISFWGPGDPAPVEPLGRDLERRRWRREVGLEADDVGGEA